MYIYPVFPLDSYKELRHVSKYMFYVQLEPVQLIEVMEDDAVPSKDFTEALVVGMVWDEHFADLHLPRKYGFL